jgi:hypothetical protein
MLLAREPVFHVFVGGSSMLSRTWLCRDTSAVPCRVVPCRAMPDNGLCSIMLSLLCFACSRFRSMASSVLRKGGGLAEALSTTAAAAGGPPGREQQHELAGDWQGAEDGLSEVELELMLAEFSYVEQVSPPPPFSPPPPPPPPRCPSGTLSWMDGRTQCET